MTALWTFICLLVWVTPLLSVHHREYDKLARSEAQRYLLGANLTQCYSVKQYQELIEQFFLRCAKPPVQLLHYRMHQNQTGTFGTLVNADSLKGSSRRDDMLELLTSAVHSRTETPEFDIIINLIDHDFVSGWIRKRPECGQLKVPIFNIVRTAKSLPYNMLFVDTEFANWMKPSSTSAKMFESQPLFEQKIDKAVFRGTLCTHVETNLHVHASTPSMKSLAYLSSISLSLSPCLSVSLSLSLSLSLCLLISLYLSISFSLTLYLYHFISLSLYLFIVLSLSLNRTEHRRLQTR